MVDFASVIDVHTVHVVTIMRTGPPVAIVVAFVPLPSLAVAVIVVVPPATPVTTPEEDTVATSVFELDQVKDLSLALLGVTVAVSVVICPISSTSEVLFKVIPVTY